MSDNNFQEKLEKLIGESVVVNTVGGQAWFGYVDKVKDGLLKLKYVETYSPACPCDPTPSIRASIPIKKITGVLFDVYYYPGGGAPASSFMDTVKRVQDRAAADAGTADDDE